MKIAVEVSSRAMQRALLALFALGVVGSAYFMGVAHAEGVPTGAVLFYSGVLEENGLLVEGPHDVVVELFDAETGGTVRCRTDALATTFTAGRFRVPLAAECVTATQTYPNLFAQVSVGVATLPRSKLGAVPYALEAERAGIAGLATDAEALNGQDASHYLALANATGTLSDGQLSSNVSLDNAANTFSGTNTFSAPPSFTSAGAPFSVSGTTKVANLNADLLDGSDASSFASSSHAHAAADLTTGTVPIARGGTGVSALTGQGNKVLAVNAAATAYEMKAVAGTPGQVSVTNTAGALTLGLAAGVPRGCSLKETSAVVNNLTISCDFGKKVVGGGGACAPSDDQGAATENRMKYTRPLSDRSGWNTVCTGAAANKGTYVYAICCTE